MKSTLNGSQRIAWVDSSNVLVNFVVLWPKLEVFGRLERDPCCEVDSQAYGFVAWIYELRGAKG